VLAVDEATQPQCGVLVASPATHFAPIDVQSKVLGTPPMHTLIAAASGLHWFWAASNGVHVSLVPRQRAALLSTAQVRPTAAQSISVCDS
jgi:hypothetical protein